MDSANDSKIKEKSIQNSPQCQFFVVRKKRLCRMTVKPGRNYCGEHEPQPRKEMGRDDTRVPCPYDPKHTCYASKMLKHLAICNARQQQGPDYIVHNINAPVNPNNAPRKLLSQFPQHRILALIEKVNILYDKYVQDKITSVAESPIHDAVLEDFQQEGRAESSLRHLRQASSLLHLMEAEQLVHDGTCYVELGAGKGHLSYYAYKAWCGENASRVLLVDRASLRHKRDNKLREPRTDYRYTGGIPNTSTNTSHGNTSNSEDGNATDISSSCSISASDNTNVSNYSTDSINGTDNLNANTNDKHDRSNKESSVVESNRADDVDSTTANSETLTGCCRIRADLAHLALERVPEVAQCEAVVGFAKHLCGAATDYALRCITASGVAQRVRGVALATCCHHRCEPASYVGTSYLQEMGIDEEDLNIMLGVVSWATCGDGRSRERRLHAAAAADDGGDSGGRKRKLSEEPEGEVMGPAGAATVAGAGPGLSVCERAAAGRRAKALLDAGRAHFLRERGFPARLCHFVPTAVSLENVCIVARKI